jgi:hypothetical protein
MRRLNSPLWLDAADTNCPAMDGAVDVDVAVVAAGITGTTAAYLLKQPGDPRQRTSRTSHPPSPNETQ